MFGSEHNDPFIVEGEKIKLEKNDAGGVVGGISTGAPLHFRVVVKPPSSIGLKQKTIDLKTGKQTEIIVGGRHDPCIVPRAVPVVEAMTAIVLADHGIRYGVIPPVIRNL
jgi:chorismate synthase